MKTRDHARRFKNRIALYLGQSAAPNSAVNLRPYFEGARASGLRVVTVRRESGGRGTEARPVLRRLVARMEAGEFDAIMTVVDPDVSPSTLPRPMLRGGSWLPYRSRRR